MKFEAVLFDCDGVLVDSEPITNGVLRDMLAEQGWRLSVQECMDIFVGKAVVDERVRIEAQTGRPLTPEWMAEFRARRNAALDAKLVAIPGAVSAVVAVHASMQGRIACASGLTASRWRCSSTKWACGPFSADASSAAMSCHVPNPIRMFTLRQLPPWAPTQRAARWKTP